MTGRLPSIAESGRALRSGQTSSERLTKEVLDRIRLYDRDLNAFVAVYADDALRAAREADRELRSGIDRGPMHGIPYGLKDIVDVSGKPSHCNSAARHDHMAESDSTLVSRLREAGAVLVGKLATYEFALGGPSPEQPFAAARNPWSPDHITGGSSSGAATAVAADMIRVAIGSDTGGSIRIPAAYCGVVGLKPTFGLVSRHGAMPLSWSLDHFGPLARTVEDAAIALRAIAGFDAHDLSSANVDIPDYRIRPGNGLKGLRIGVARSFFSGSPLLSPSILAAFEQACLRLQDGGALLEDVALPDYRLFHGCGWVIMLSEAFAIHKRQLQSRHDLYGSDTLRRLVLGATITSSDYLDALRVRHRLTDAMARLFDRFDVLVSLPVLTTAMRRDQPPASISTSPTQTYPFNVTGHPAISVPLGLSQEGMPMAIQLAGRYFDEATLLQVAAEVERDLHVNQGIDMYCPMPASNRGLA